jgi:hypothetical protein
VVCDCMRVRRKQKNRKLSAFVKLLSLYVFLPSAETWSKLYLVLAALN